MYMWEILGYNTIYLLIAAAENVPINAQYIRTKNGVKEPAP